MKVKSTKLHDVLEIVPTRHGDARGYFSETFRADWFEANIARASFVQENQSLSHKRGVVRGLHFQSDPFAQGKLVRCIGGAVFDVAVDIRHGSPQFGRWTAVVLSAEACNQLWIPPGFLHGFCTLTWNAVVNYKVTAYYSPRHEVGVRWDDAEIDIDWPSIADPSTLSDRDARQPRLSEIGCYFDHAGVS
jgi:dTDP-4-dehydrorhamnose 3,5-epimerase